MPVPQAVDLDGFELPGWAKLLLVLAGGIAVSGLLDFALANAGYEGLAALVWATGYAGTLIVVWLAWGQHLELVGDTGVGHDAPASERSHTDEPDGATADESATAEAATRESPPESY